MYEDSSRKKFDEPPKPPTAVTSFDIIFGDPNWRGVDQLIEEWEMFLKKKKEELLLMQQKIPSKKEWPEKDVYSEPGAKSYYSGNDYVAVPHIHSSKHEWPCVHKDQIIRNTHYFKHFVAPHNHPVQGLGINSVIQTDVEMSNFADTLSTLPIPDYKLQSLPHSHFHQCPLMFSLLSSDNVRESLSKNMAPSRRTDVNGRSVCQQPIDILDEIMNLQ
ncbi:uncharacterized protein LOC111088404 [Limulus polyphemus]|uniref:Uncharacterized protein LOC111088404 n=1 Tax=Limulus polyphemus TaxID=6850 RepID=A0ABM1TE34_LIMPO|nr:uncharacterized protein LOC111088404 [Limulus polyphemus]